MTQMNFFKRPQITGRNVPRLRHAEVRGSIRRAEADGFSAVPYFPGVSSGQTLLVSITTPPDASPTISNITVTLSGNSMSSIIDDINTALGASGRAVDEDGSLAIRTEVQGGLGFVHVTGGTASKLLGFNTVGVSLRSTGGDMPSAPEGRSQNAFDVAVPIHGEGLNSATYQRALARVSANTDVLFSDAAKQHARLQRVSSFTVAGDGSYITPDSAVRVFTGGPSASNTQGRLSASSSKEDLAPYFFIYDTVTKQPSQSRVVAVTRGVPSGNPAYSNATSWSGVGSTGNVLGVDLVKQSAIGIVSIREGRIVELVSALDAAVVEGDLIEIVGATNILPWVNNGLRWVLETKIDSTNIIVRPMSMAELAQMGQSFTDTHPVVELNGDKDNTQSFGTISVHTGYATTGVNLTIRPPVPQGASYEIWAAQPISGRDSKTWLDTYANSPASIAPQNDLDTTRNFILSRSRLDLNNPSAGYIRVDGYYVRWHGRTCFVPQVDLQPADGTGFIVWDEATCSTILKATSSTTAFNGDSGSTPASSQLATLGSRCQPIGTYSASGGSITAVDDMTKIEGEARASNTVGYGGDFPDLTTALYHITKMRSANGETSSANGSYPHMELVLLNDQNFAGGVIDGPTGLVIRGITPNVHLKFIGSSGFAPSAASGFSLVLKDLTLQITGSTGITLVDGCSRLTMDNVIQDMSGSAYAFVTIVKPAANAKINLTNCVLYSAGGLIWGGTGHEIRLKNLSLTYTAHAGVSVSQIISSSSSGATNGATTIAKFSASDCIFADYPASQTYPLFVVDNSSGRYDFNNCYFSFDTVAPPVTDSVLMTSSSGFVTMTNCVVDGKSGSAVIGTIIDSFGSVDTHVHSCKFDIRPRGSQYTNGLKVRTASKCTITCFDAGAGQVNGIAMRVSESAIGNNISGPVQKGIEATTSGNGITISGNKINLTTAANNTANVAGVSVTVSNAQVVGNHISSSYSGFKGIVATAAQSNLIVTGNSVTIYGISNGIDLTAPVTSVISGNVITNTNGDYGIAISVSAPKRVTIDGNTIKSTKSAGTSYAGAGITGTETVTGSDITIVGNNILAFTPLEINPLISVVVTGNRVEGDAVDLTGSFHNNYCVGQFIFNNSSGVTGNTFAVAVSPFGGSGGVILKPTTVGCFLSFTDNDVLTVNGANYGVEVRSAVSGSNFEISGNRITNTTYILAASNVIVSDNLFEQTVTVEPAGGASGCHFTFSDNIANGGLTEITTCPNSHAVISGNGFVYDSLNYTTSGFSRDEISNNKVYELNIVVTAASEPFISVTGNTIDIGLTTVFESSSLPRLQVTSNVIGESAIIDPALGSATFGDNTVYGDLVITSSIVSNNYIAGTTVLNGLVNFSANSLNNTLTVAASSNAQILGNYVNGDVIFTGTDCAVTYSDNISLNCSLICSYVGIVPSIQVSNSSMSNLVVTLPIGLADVHGCKTNGDVTITAEDIVFANNLCVDPNKALTITATNQATLSASFVYTFVAGIVAPTIDITGCGFSSTSYDIGNNSTMSSKVSLSSVAFGTGGLTIKGDCLINGLRSGGPVTMTAPSGGFKNFFRASSLVIAGALNVSSTDAFEVIGLDTSGLVSVGLTSVALPMSLSESDIGPSANLSITKSGATDVKFTNVHAGTTIVSGGPGSDTRITGCELGNLTLQAQDSIFLSDSKFLAVKASVSSGIVNISGCVFTTLQSSGGADFDSTANITDCKFTSMNSSAGAGRVSLSNCTLTGNYTVNGSECNVHLKNCVLGEFSVNSACNDTRVFLSGCTLTKFESLGDIRESIVDGCKITASSGAKCFTVQKSSNVGNSASEQPSSLLVSNNVITMIGDTSSDIFAVYLGESNTSYLSNMIFSNNVFRVVKTSGSTTSWYCVYAIGMLKECQFIGNKWESTEDGSADGPVVGSFNGGTADTVNDANRNVLFSGNLSSIVNSTGTFVKLRKNLYAMAETAGTTWNPVAGASILMASNNTSFGLYGSWQFTV